MPIYKTELTVTKEDLDELNHVNNVRYVQWINDIAKAHWLKNASKQLLENYYWVVINHNIHYKGAAFLNETLSLKTYVIKSEGVSSTRIVEIYNKQTKKLLVKSQTSFCLINSKSHKPSRITEEIIDLF